MIIQFLSRIVFNKGHPFKSLVQSARSFNFLSISLFEKNKRLKLFFLKFNLLCRKGESQTEVFFRLFRPVLIQNPFASAIARL